MTPQRVFLTGEPGCGKTTAVENTIQFLKDRGKTVGGVVSREIRENGVRMGFSLIDVLTNMRGMLAHANQNGGPRVGKYHVNLPDIANIGVAAIERAIAEADVIVVDELGPMELKSTAFTAALRKALVSSKPFLGTIHKRASHELVNEIKSKPQFRIIEVTLENRDTLPLELAERFTS